MDKGTLYRLALSKLGSKAQLVEGTPEFEALDECAQQAVAFALDYSAWDFAMKGPITLVLTEGRAVLPGDCIELREVSLPRWRKVDRYLISENAEAKEAEIVYKSREISDAMALPDHEPLFCEACVSLVAGAIAGRVTGNANIGIELTRAGQELLYRARLKEARSTTSNDQQPKKGGRPWVMV